jgi:hypothetical protein
MQVESREEEGLKEGGKIREYGKEGRVGGREVGKGNRA